MRLALVGLWASVGIVTLAPVPVHLQPARAPSLRRAVEDAEGTSWSRRVGVLAAALRECSIRLTKEQRLHLARIIHSESEQRGWDPLFIAALVQIESGCKPTAVGGGAIGLTQMLPSTAREVARRAGVRWRGPSTLTEPEISVQLGLHYLGELEEMFDDPYKAVAAYNMGPAPVMRMSSTRARSTRYVRKILTRYERLLEQYT